MNDPSQDEAFDILRSHGFNPTAMGLDYAVQGLADRLARTERALAETREMLARAQRGAAAVALDAEGSDLVPLAPAHSALDAALKKDDQQLWGVVDEMEPLDLEAAFLAADRMMRVCEQVLNARHKRWEDARRDSRG